MKLLVLVTVLVSFSHGGWAYCSFSGKVPVEASCCDQPSVHCCKAYTGMCFCSAAHVCSKPKPKCCGDLQKTTTTQCFLFGCKTTHFYTYWPTKFEMDGRCKRVPRMDYNVTQTVMPNPLPGPCQCKTKDVPCTNATIITTTTTTTTKRTTTSKTTTPPTTTTKTTTTTPPTTTASPVCPTPPATTSGRVLGGALVAGTCTDSSTVNFRLGPFQVCNGVVGYSPTKKSNQIYITDFCSNFMQAVAKVQSFEIVGFYEYIGFNVSSALTSVGNSISSFDLPAVVSNSAKCKNSACVYNAATMSSLIDFNSCYISSYGYDVIFGQTTYNTGGLHKVNVTKQATCSSKPATPSAQCFTAVNPAVRGCWGDSGAPVFCHLTTTNEKVLYGLVDAIQKPPQELTGVASPNLCNSSPEFHVLPIS